MDIAAGLNPQQRLAVEHGTGPALVLAGAGSGKTRVIAHRIAYLIRNGAARPENILAVTFTNKAAREMQERVRKLLGPARGSEPLISTFHSFCVRLLRREIHRLGYRRDFSIYDTDDQRRLIKQILEETGEDDDSGLSPRELISRISYAKNHGVPHDGYAARFPSEVAEDIGRIYEIYDARLRQSNALDFDDLLLKAVAVLDQERDLRKHYSGWYRYILVDEYQDTNRPQYELLRLLTCTHRNLFVVGDEDQSIYKFRGADIGNILRFEKDFPGARIIKLEQNYRSSGNILRVAGAVVANNTERKGKVLWTENSGGEIVTCFQAESAREEASWVVERIRDILDEDPDCRIAVLYRANFLSRNFEDVLIEEGIPYAVVGSVAFFGRMEIKDLLAYLRVVFNPEDDLALLRIINTPPRGIGSTTLEAVTKEALERGVPILETVREKARDPSLPGRASKALLHFLELLDKWTALQKTASIAQMIETILEDTRYKEMLRKQETEAEAENRLANIEELLRAAAESETRGETVSDFLDRAALSSELDQLDPDARVSLMTLHSAKGLEFDTVFLVAMEEGIFPHIQSMESKQDLEEERRLCYVGITRAKRKLYVTWALYRKKYGPDAGFPSEVSRFLNEMPRDLLEGFEDFEDAEPYFPARRPRRGDRFYESAEDYVPVSRLRRKRAETHPQPKSIAELRAYMERMRREAEPRAAGGKAAPLLKPGMRVYHEQFGDGIILKRERTGNEIKLTVTFSRAGRKSLIERYAKLRPL